MTTTQKIAIEIVCKVLYVPVMIILVGLSGWWFSVTNDFENPVLLLLWDFVRATPGLVGFTGMLMGAIMLTERWW